MTVRVLLVDDDAIVRAGLRLLLETHEGFEVVGEASDGAGGVSQVKIRRPDVVLMDVQMPGVDGIEATRRIAELDLEPPTRVLVLTTFEVDAYVFEALRAGASGFVLKRLAPEDLIHAVRTVAGGEALLAPSVTRRLIEEFARQPEPTKVDDGHLDTLTDRERDVLLLLARGMSNAEIAAELFLSPLTVKTHVAHLLAKLGLRDRTQAVVFAYESGLVSAGRATE